MITEAGQEEEEGRRKRRRIGGKMFEEGRAIIKKIQGLV